MATDYGIDEEEEVSTQEDDPNPYDQFTAQSVESAPEAAPSENPYDSFDQPSDAQLGLRAIEKALQLADLARVATATVGVPQIPDEVQGTTLDPQALAEYQKQVQPQGRPLGYEIPMPEDWAFAQATGGGLPGVMAGAGKAFLAPLEAAGESIFGHQRDILGLDTGNVTPAHETLFNPLFVPGPDEKGIIPSLGRTVAGLATPGNLGAMMAAPLAPTGVLSSFISQVPAGVGQSLQELTQAQTGPETRGAITDLATTLAFGELMRRGITRKRGTNARSQQETAAVHGDLLTSPIEGEGQVPIQEGGPGVQPRPGSRLSQEAQVLLDAPGVKYTFGSNGEGNPAQANLRTGEIVIDAHEFNQWVEKDLAGLSPEMKARNIRGMFNHEGIHLVTPPEAAIPFWESLTDFERWSFKRNYLKGRPEESPENMGFEAIRNRVERAMKLDRSDFLHLVGVEKWTAHTLDYLANLYGRIRRFNTGLNAEQKRILDHVIGNFEAAREMQKLVPPVKLQDLTDEEKAELQKSFDDVNADLSEAPTPEDVPEAAGPPTKTISKVQPAPEPEGQMRTIEQIRILESDPDINFDPDKQNQLNDLKAEIRWEKRRKFPSPSMKREKEPPGKESKWVSPSGEIIDVEDHYSGGYGILRKIMTQEEWNKFSSILNPREQKDSYTELFRRGWTRATFDPSEQRLYAEKGNNGGEEIPIKAISALKNWGIEKGYPVEEGLQFRPGGNRASRPIYDPEGPSMKRKATHDEVANMDDAEAMKFYKELRSSGSNPQRDGVEYGLTLDQSDVPKLTELRDHAHQSMMEKIRKGEADQGQSMGKVIWLSAAIEGAKREGSNYEGVLAKQGPRILLPERIREMAGMVQRGEPIPADVIHEHNLKVPPGYELEGDVYRQTGEGPSMKRKETKSVAELREERARAIDALVVAKTPQEIEKAELHLSAIEGRLEDLINNFQPRNPPEYYAFKKAVQSFNEDVAFEKGMSGEEQSFPAMKRRQTKEELQAKLDALKAAAAAGQEPPKLSKPGQPEYAPVPPQERLGAVEAGALPGPMGPKRIAPAVEGPVTPDKAKFFTNDFLEKTAQAIPEIGIRETRLAGQKVPVPVVAGAPKFGFDDYKQQFQTRFGPTPEGAMRETYKNGLMIFLFHSKGATLQKLIRSLNLSGRFAGRGKMPGEVIPTAATRIADPEFSAPELGPQMVMELEGKTVSGKAKHLEKAVNRAREVFELELQYNMGMRQYRQLRAELRDLGVSDVTEKGQPLDMNRGRIKNPTGEIRKKANDAAAIMRQLDEILDPDKEAREKLVEIGSAHKKPTTARLQQMKEEEGMMPRSAFEPRPPPKTKLFNRAQRRRFHIIATIYDELAKAAEVGKKSAQRTEITPDDIGSQVKAKEPVFYKITSRELRRPDDVAQRLVQDSRTFGGKVSLTHRLAVMVSNESGRVDVIDVYLDPRRGPVGMSTVGTGVHQPLETLFKTHRPVYSIYLDEPVANFRKRYPSLSEFENQFGKRAAQQSAGAEFVIPGEEGIEVLGQGKTRPVVGPNMLERELKGRLREDQSQAVYDAIFNEVRSLENPQEVLDTLNAIHDRAHEGEKINRMNLKAIAGFNKIFEHLKRKYPEADDQRVMEMLAKSIYENYQTSRSYEDLSKRLTNRHGGQAEMAGQEGAATGAAETRLAQQEAIQSAEQRARYFSSRRPLDEWLKSRQGLSPSEFEGRGRPGIRPPPAQAFIPQGLPQSGARALTARSGRAPITSPEYETRRAMAVEAARRAQAGPEHAATSPIPEPAGQRAIESAARLKREAITEAEKENFAEYLKFKEKTGSKIRYRDWRARKEIGHRPPSQYKSSPTGEYFKNYFRDIPKEESGKETEEGPSLSEFLEGGEAELLQPEGEGPSMKRRRDINYDGPGLIGNIASGMVNGRKTDHLLKGHIDYRGISEGSQRWRYDPQANVVTWVNKPTPESMDLLDNYLHKQGITPDRHERLFGWPNSDVFRREGEFRGEEGGGPSMKRKLSYDEWDKEASRLGKLYMNMPIGRGSEQAWEKFRDHFKAYPEYQKIWNSKEYEGEPSLGPGLGPNMKRRGGERLSFHEWDREATRLFNVYQQRLEEGGADEAAFQDFSDHMEAYPEYSKIREKGESSGLPNIGPGLGPNMKRAADAAKYVWDRVKTPGILDRQAIEPDFTNPLPRIPENVNEALTRATGIERTWLGRLWGPRANIREPADRSVVGYSVKRNMGNSLAAIIGKIIRDVEFRLRKPFKQNPDGEIINLDAVRGVSKRPSDVFEAWQRQVVIPENMMKIPGISGSDIIKYRNRNPAEYNLTKPQDAFFRILLTYIRDGHKYLEEKKASMLPGEYRQPVLVGMGDEMTVYPLPRVALQKKGIPPIIANVQRRIGGSYNIENERLYKTEEEGAKTTVYEPDMVNRAVTFMSRVYKAVADADLANDPALKGENIKDRRERLAKEYEKEIKSGEMSLENLEQITRKGRLSQDTRVESHPAFAGKIFPIEIANKLERAFGEQTHVGVRHLGQISRALKAFELTADLAQFTQQGLPTMIRNPAVFSRAMIGSLKAFNDPNVLGKVMQDPEMRKAAIEFVQHGSTLSYLQDFMSGSRPGEIAAQIPYIRQVVIRSGQSFGTFLDLAKLYLWRALKEGVPKEQLPELAEQIENMTLSGRMEASGMHPGRALAERIVLMAPSYYRAAIQHVSAAAEGAYRLARGQGGQYRAQVEALKTFSTFIAGIHLLMYGAYKAAGMDSDEIRRRMVPGGSKYLRYPVHIGKRVIEIGPGGISLGLVDLLGKVVDTARTDPKDFLSGGSNNPFVQWGASKLGPVPSWLYEQRTGKDFSGRPVTALESTVNKFLPISAQTAFQTAHRQQPAAAGVESGASFIGLKATTRSPASDLREIVDDKLKHSADPREKAIWKQHRAQQDVFISDYRPLRDALVKGQLGQARREYLKLTQIKGNSKQTAEDMIDEAMNPKKGTITGLSREIEKELKDRMTRSETRTLEAAEDEKERLYELFDAIAD